MTVSPFAVDGLHCNTQRFASRRGVLLRTAQEARLNISHAQEARLNISHLCGEVWLGARTSRLNAMLLWLGW
jgi:hypothetical protein